MANLTRTLVFRRLVAGFMLSVFQSFVRRLLAIQFVRFCLVGASSTILDTLVLVALLKGIPTLPWFVSKSAAFAVGVTNGFFLNRRWTFGSQSHDLSRRQYPKFVITNLIGLGINLTVAKLVLVVLTGKVAMQSNPEAWKVVLASLCAIPVSVIWNFCAARFWTFKAPTSPPPVPNNPPL